jgi:hypothetical protein
MKEKPPSSPVVGRRDGIHMTKPVRCLAAGLVVVALLGSCTPSPSYRTFISQNEAYYKRIADACDSLRTNTAAGRADGNKISPASMSVPDALLALNPAYYRITTNRVFISIGVGRGSYGIAWERSQINASVWELRTYAESLERVHFTREEKTSWWPIPQ